MCKANENKGSQKIAVVGIGCRFPGANNWREYWSLLADGKCAIGDLPESRRNLERGHTSDECQKFRCGYLDNIDMFDPLFFGITPREAACMDPQHRLLLEVVWEAFEDAGIVVKNLAGSNTGIFIAMGPSSYYYQQECRNMADIYSVSGGMSFGAVNRISYLFDFHGPCFCIDSACSSVLTAVDEACMRIQKGDCTIAVAGGANVFPFTALTPFFAKARLISPEGVCRAFDEKADGYVRGEGVGVVVLKSLSRALEDGDTIYAVIAGSALNHGGRNGRGFTYPNPTAQEALLKTAYQNANIRPDQVYYVEAHGTGTPVGDEIELTGIANVVAPGRKKDDYCMIGAVKTNIGHLEYAAGIASLIKVCLILKEKKIPPSLHFEKFNPNIDFENMPIRVQTQLTSWPQDKRMVAGVSAFGLGGSNAHIVLESIDNYLKDQCTDQLCAKVPAKNENYLFPVSAQSHDALRDNSSNYIKFMEENREFSLQDFCYSASVRKDHFNHRLVIKCTSKEDLSCKLKEFAAGNYDNDDIFHGETYSGKPMAITFAFSDCNDSWLESDQKKLFKIPLFLEVLKEVDQIYRSIAHISLVNEIDSNHFETAMSNHVVADPLFFSFQVAMTEVWQRNGVSPSGMVGYGQGEITAAYLSELLTLEAALQLIHARAVLLDTHSVPGKMINVIASLKEMESFVAKYDHKAYISAINSPTVLTLSGDSKNIETIENHLTQEGFFWRKLSRRHPLYCPLMGGISDKLLFMIEPLIGKTEIANGTTSREWSGDRQKYGPQYWQKQLMERIDFANRISTLIQQGCYNYIEIGEGASLSFYITDTLNELNQDGLVISSLNKDNSLEYSITKGLAELYVSGYPLPWQKLIPNSNFVKFPNYAWQKQSYWI